MTATALAPANGRALDRAVPCVTVIGASERAAAVNEPLCMKFFTAITSCRWGRGSPDRCRSGRYGPYPGRAMDLFASSFGSPEGVTVNG
jgi:hypothetical protein